MRYTPLARALHWLSALAILAVAVLGLVLAYAAPAEEALKMRLYNIHESIGIALVPVTLLRLWWQRRNPPPPLPDGLAPALRLAAHATHAGLYAVLLLQPLVGLAATNAWGFPLAAFGLIPIPNLVAPDEGLAPLLSGAHTLLAFGLIALLAAHIGAALVHHLVWKDDTLRRML